MEHWTWNTEYMERGTLESWNIGTLVMERWTWNTGHGTLVMERWTWNTGQIEHRPREHWIWNTGTLSMEHWIHGRLETTTVAHWAWNTETLNIEHSAWNIGHGTGQQHKTLDIKHMDHLT